MTVVIRAAVPDDLDAVVELDRAALGGAAWSRRVVAEEFAGTTRLVVVAELDSDASDPGPVETVSFESGGRRPVYGGGLGLGDSSADGATSRVPARVGLAAVRPPYGDRPSATAVVGYAIGCYVAETADVHRVAVLPSLRRSGLGSLLLSELVGEAERRGCDRMLLEVAADNVGALGFYATHRFETLDRRRRYYAGDVDAVIMQRRIGSERSAGGSGRQDRRGRNARQGDSR